MGSSPMMKHMMHIFREAFWVAVGGVLSLCLLVGCQAPAKPVPVPSPLPEPAQVQPAPLPDDIPANVSPAVRDHLLKLRELRDTGRLSERDYQSRRALLIGM